MIPLARTFLVACTAVSALLASSLQGKVLCFGDEGHAAIEAPHAHATCPAADDGHGHERDHDCGHHRDEERHPPCSDVSANLLAVRGGCPAALELAHVDLVLLPPPTQDALITSLHQPRLPCGIGTHPPSDGSLACLRSVVLLV